MADRTRWVLQQPGSVERLEAAAVRRLERHADTDGTGKLAKECPVIRASDLIRDRVERRRMEQTNEDGGRGRRTRGSDLAKASQYRYASVTRDRSYPSEGSP